MKCNIRCWIWGAVASLAAAAMWCVPGGDVQAKGKPGGGGGKTEVRLARILFVDSPGIRWDEQSSCTDPILGETWDYWDYRDPVLNDPACIPCRIDVSGGGRVKFFTTGWRDRWLTLDFRANSDLHPDPYFDTEGNGPNIDAKVYPGTLNAPTIEADDLIDNVKATITLSGMFKKTATRQPLDVTVRVYNEEGGGWPGAGWSLHSQVDLYILDTEDPSVRTLTTRNPVTEDQDAALFDLWNNGVKVGTYYFPLEWEMRILAAP